MDTLAEVSDEALLVAFGNGDRQAARSLTNRLLPAVFGLAVRLLGNPTDAEDVAQEVMIKLWKIAPDWRQGEAKVSTWLYRVVTNLCMDRLRKKTGVALDAIPEPEDGRPSAEAKLIDQTRQLALQQALNDLPDRQKQAVVLRHIQGVSNPDIATIMDISIEAVESLTARGKRALGQALAGRQAELGYCDD